MALAMDILHCALSHRALSYDRHCVAKHSKYHPYGCSNIFLELILLLLYCIMMCFEITLFWHRTYWFLGGKIYFVVLRPGTQCSKLQRFDIFKLCVLLDIWHMGSGYCVILIYVLPFLCHFLLHHILEQVLSFFTYCTFDENLTWNGYMIIPVAYICSISSTYLQYLSRWGEDTRDSCIGFM